MKQLYLVVLCLMLIGVACSSDDEVDPPYIPNSSSVGLSSSTSSTSSSAVSSSSVASIYAVFSGLTANGSSGAVSTTALTLTFDVDPNGLVADDITVTGAKKGLLSGTGSTRTLTISDITVANNETVSVAITSSKGLVITGSPRTVVVYKAPIAVSFVSLTANGVSGSVVTTALTLTFDVDPASLTASDITLTGATKGTLSGSGTSRTLAISAITVANGSEITVALANPAGYAIAGSSKTVSVYKVVYTVTFNSQGGDSPNPGSLVVAFNEAYGTLATTSRTGYVFDGWWTGEGGSGSKVLDGTIVSTTGNHSLYAKWTKVPYLITYNLDGGENVAGNPGSYTVDTPTITLQDPTKIGYTFCGWFSNAGLTTPVTSIASGSTGDRVLYAKWSLDIYVAGAESYRVKYWKNGVPVNLTTGTPSGAAYSIFVSGSDVYVAGNEGIYAKYWKNGSVVQLLTSYDYSTAYSIAVAGAKVYVSGYFQNGSDYRMGYWVNGSMTQDGYRAAKGYSCFVSGADFYVAGYDTLSNIPYTKQACYWKNCAKTVLDTSTSEANSIYISGADIYVTGFVIIGTKSFAYYWKNGVATALTTGTQNAAGTSVFVSGTDVYVAGYESNGTYDVAKYWKNGVAVLLSDGTRNARSTQIALSGTDVYVSGYDGNTALYWKNGVAVPLSDGSTYAVANSIFFK